MYKLGRSIGNMITLNVFNFYHKYFIYKTFELVLIKIMKTYSFVNFFAFFERILANNKRKEHEIVPSFPNVNDCIKPLSI